MTSRRTHRLGGAAFITALAPRRAGAEVTTPDELKTTPLRAHADAPQGLAEDHGRLPRQRGSKEKAQVVATNGEAPRATPS